MNNPVLEDNAAKGEKKDIRNESSRNALDTALRPNSYTGSTKSCGGTHEVTNSSKTIEGYTSRHSAPPATSLAIVPFVPVAESLGAVAPFVIRAKECEKVIQAKDISSGMTNDTFENDDSWNATGSATLTMPPTKVRKLQLSSIVESCSSNEITPELATRIGKGSDTFSAIETANKRRRIRRRRKKGQGYIEARSKQEYDKTNYNNDVVGCDQLPSESESEHETLPSEDDRQLFEEQSILDAIESHENTDSNGILKRKNNEDFSLAEQLMKMARVAFTTEFNKQSIETQRIVTQAPNAMIALAERVPSYCGPIVVSTQEEVGIVDALNDDPTRTNGEIIVILDREAQDQAVLHSDRRGPISLNESVADWWSSDAEPETASKVNDNKLSTPAQSLDASKPPGNVDVAKVPQGSVTTATDQVATNTTPNPRKVYHHNPYKRNNKVPLSYPKMFAGTKPARPLSDNPRVTGKQAANNSKESQKNEAVATYIIENNPSGLQPTYYRDDGTEYQEDSDSTAKSNNQTIRSRRNTTVPEVLTNHTTEVNQNTTTSVLSINETLAAASPHEKNDTGSVSQKETVLSQHDVKTAEDNTGASTQTDVVSSTNEEASNDPQPYSNIPESSAPCPFHGNKPISKLTAEEYHNYRMSLPRCFPSFPLQLSMSGINLFMGKTLPVSGDPTTKITASVCGARYGVTMDVNVVSKEKLRWLNERYKERTTPAEGVREGYISLKFRHSVEEFNTKMLAGGKSKRLE